MKIVTQIMPYEVMLTGRQLKEGKLYICTKNISNQDMVGHLVYALPCVMGGKLKYESDGFALFDLHTNVVYKDSAGDILYREAPANYKITLEFNNKV